MKLNQHRFTEPRARKGEGGYVGDLTGQGSNGTSQYIDREQVTRRLLKHLVYQPQKEQHQ